MSDSICGVPEDQRYPLGARPWKLLFLVIVNQLVRKLKPRKCPGSYPETADWKCEERTTCRSKVEREKEEFT